MELTLAMLKAGASSSTRSSLSDRVPSLALFFLPFLSPFLPGGGEGDLELGRLSSTLQKDRSINQGGQVNGSL